MCIEHIALKFREHYDSLSLPIPDKVEALFKNAPPGLGRTVLRNRYNITGYDLLKVLHKDYVKSNSTEEAFLFLLEKVDRLGLILLNKEEITADVANNKSIKTTNVITRCPKCDSIDTRSYDSFRAISIGCNTCAGNRKLSPEEKIDKVTKAYNGTCTVLSLSKETTELECNTCKHTFSRNTHRLLYSSDLKCPQCFPNKIIPVVYNNIQFNSRFESDCYKLLEKELKSNLKVLTHIKYKEFLDISENYESDFIISDNLGNYLLSIEVTSYRRQDVVNSQLNKYFISLDKKVSLVSEQNFEVEVVHSLAELTSLIQKINTRYSLN